MPGYHRIIPDLTIARNVREFTERFDIGGGGGKGSIYGATVVAANSGTVIIACTDGHGGGYGNYVVVDHGSGEVTIYAHLSFVKVSVGQHVGKGQDIGRVGSTGYSTGPHLHFEYRANGVRTNPSAILSY